MLSDRQDKSAVGWDHQEKVDKHQSQKDYKTGFGGKFGVQNDRVDKSAVGWEHVEKVEKHKSQKGKQNEKRVNKNMNIYLYNCGCLCVRNIMLFTLLKEQPRERGAFGATNA